MRLTVKTFVAIFVALVVAGPAVAAPRLSLHTPTLTAPAPVQPDPALPFSLGPAGVSLGMAIRIKDTGALAQKFAQRAGAASGDYTSGVQSAGQDWQANALAAEGSYVQGVQESIADKRFSRGIQEAGAAKYVQNATTLGPQRYQQGVSNASAAWAKGVQPHLDAMRQADLGPRGPKGSAQNYQRAQKAAQLNRAIKLQK